MQYALTRLNKRDFFEIKALPRWDIFRNKIPIAVIGFSGVSPLTIEEIKKQSKDEIRLMAHGERDIIMIIVASSEEDLDGNIRQLIDRCKQDPCIFMKNPSLSRLKPTFPKNVLEQVFADLPDRRIKLK